MNVCDRMRPEKRQTTECRRMDYLIEIRVCQKPKGWDRRIVRPIAGGRKPGWSILQIQMRRRDDGTGRRTKADQGDGGLSFCYNRTGKQVRGAGNTRNRVFFRVNRLKTCNVNDRPEETDLNVDWNTQYKLKITKQVFTLGVVHVGNEGTWHTWGLDPQVMTILFTMTMNGTLEPKLKQ